MDDAVGGAEARPQVQALEVIRTFRAWLLIAAGAILLILCYVGVSGESEVSRQLPYLVSGGFGGLAFVLVGSALVVADRLGGGAERTGRQVDDLHTLIVASAEPAPDSSDGVTAGRA